MHKAIFNLALKRVGDADERKIAGIMTSPSVDRMGDVIDPSGCEFSLPITLLWQHHHDQPIGHVLAARAGPTGISFEAQLAQSLEPGKLKDRLDEAWQSIKLGLVRSVSIGFVPVESEPLPGGGIRYTRVEIIELSAVTIPANADAVIVAVRNAAAQRGRASPGGGHIVRLTERERAIAALHVEADRSLERRQRLGIEPDRVVQLSVDDFVNARLKKRHERTKARESARSHDGVVRYRRPILTIRPRD